MILVNPGMSMAVPGKQVNFAQALQGEQYIEIFGDVPAEGRLTQKMEIAEVLDKGSGAAIVINGDLNPLHIDPNMALLGGFNTPILHGLCSLGYSVRLVLRAYADYDVSLFKSVKARFTKPVFPGQTLKVDMWKEGNRIYFETSVVENGQVVISDSLIPHNPVFK